MQENAIIDHIPYYSQEVLQQNRKVCRGFTRLSNATSAKPSPWPIPDFPM